MFKPSVAKTLPRFLYTAAQVQELDRTAIEQFGIPGAVLMRRAGAAALTLLRKQWPQARRITVVCGAGNNGGDGYIVARLASKAGFSVQVLHVGDPARLKGDALSAAQAAKEAGLQAQAFKTDALTGQDLIVDALLGTGLRGEVSGPWREAIEALNRTQTPVLAIDIPSGLSADTGRILGSAVKAYSTISFIGLKQGLLTADGLNCCGEIAFADLQVPEGVYQAVTPGVEQLCLDELLELLPPRQRAAHKGHFGHVLVVGGTSGMAGAARLCGEAAARVGAGLVSVATEPNHAPFIGAARPELMVHGVASSAELAGLLDKASVVAVGPGFGQSPWARQLMKAVLATPLPMVVDADGLNLLSTAGVWRKDWVLTPHPGEAARLLDVTTAEIQGDRFAAVKQLQHRFGGVCVLKGAGSLVVGVTGTTGLCGEGNPGMASGGMGDALTGAIAGFLAQGLTPLQAAQLGVCLHARAGDLASRAGERGLLATDLIDQLRPLVNPARI